MNLRQIATAIIALSSFMFTQTAPLFAQSAQQQGFHVDFPHLHNPFKTYTPVNVPKPDLNNSVRLDQCIHDGKLYLSVDDAIDLALENNLDIAVSRYDLPIANMDVLRTAAGGNSLWASPVSGAEHAGRRKCVKRCIVRQCEWCCRRFGRPGTNHGGSRHPGSQL